MQQLHHAPLASCSAPRKSTTAASTGRGKPGWSPNSHEQDVERSTPAEGVAGAPAPKPPRPYTQPASCAGACHGSHAARARAVKHSAGHTLLRYIRSRIVPARRAVCKYAEPLQQVQHTKPRCKHLCCRCERCATVPCMEPELLPARRCAGSDSGQERGCTQPPPQPEGCHTADCCLPVPPSDPSRHLPWAQLVSPSPPRSPYRTRALSSGRCYARLAPVPDGSRPRRPSGGQAKAGLRNSCRIPPSA